MYPIESAVGFLQNDRQQIIRLSTAGHRVVLAVFDLVERRPTYSNVLLSKGYTEYSVMCRFVDVSLVVPNKLQSVQNLVQNRYQLVSPLPPHNNVRRALQRRPLKTSCR